VGLKSWELDMEQIWLIQVEVVVVVEKELSL
jgi:hypothetical protein